MIPTAKGIAGAQTEWDAAAAGLRNEAAKIDEQAAGAGAFPTNEELRARAAQLRARLGEDEAELEGVQP